MIITALRGNLLNDDADALVNTVNCVGVMGAGIAKQFKQRYPEMFEAYRADCRAGLYRVGHMGSWYFRDEASGRVRLVVNFPTKQHWRDPSRLEWVRHGLRDLRSLVEQSRPEITSIAVPPLGCGLGGLDYRVVRPMIEEILGSAAVDHEVEVRLYLPN